MDTGVLPMAEPAQEVDRLLDEYVTVWNEGDYSKLPDVTAESITLHDPETPADGIRGRDALEEYLRELRTAFPDFSVALDDVLAAEDVVMGKWTVTGTHEGEFEGIPPTEREMELEGMDRILIEDGKVREHRIYYDTRELAEQLGVADE